MVGRRYHRHHSWLTEERHCHLLQLVPSNYKLPHKSFYSREGKDVLTFFPYPC